MIGPTVLPYYVTIFSAIAAPVIAVGRAWSRRRGRLENDADACAHCGTQWELTEDGTADAHLVEGQLVCGACAPRMRRRTVVAVAVFGFLAGAMIYLGWGPIIGTMSRFGVIDGLASLSTWAWLMCVLPPVIMLGSADVVLRSMRRDNVRALEALGRARLLTHGGEYVVAKLPRAEEVARGE